MNAEAQQKFLFKNTVTLLVGIICKGGIVIATDSRTFDDDTKVIDDTTQKVHLIQLKNRRAIVARSGHDMLSAVAIEHLQRDAKEATVKHPLDVVELAEQAMGKVREQVRGQFKEPPEALQQHFRDHTFSLLVANYFERQPSLCELKFHLGRSTPVRSGMFALGCAAPLAEFLLRDMDFGAMKPEEAMLAAIAAVEEAKLTDPRVGGPVRFGITSWYNGKLATACFDNAVPERTIGKIREYNRAKKREWQAGLKGLIESV